MGLLLAILAVRSTANRKKSRKSNGDHGIEGTCIGTAMGTAIGMCIRKKPEDAGQ